jgi:hypothetical protein
VPQSTTLPRAPGPKVMRGLKHIKMNGTYTWQQSYNTNEVYQDSPKCATFMNLVPLVTWPTKLTKLANIKLARRDIAQVYIQSIDNEIAQAVWTLLFTVRRALN